VLRAEDVVARWGGEEFIALLPDTAGDAASSVAERAREALSCPWLGSGDDDETLTASFGVTTHRHEQALELTIAAADRALYRAKEAGRDRVVLAD
jgi:diguanylate cyclase (GGDEF)-like protein